MTPKAPSLLHLLIFNPKIPNPTPTDLDQDPIFLSADPDDLSELAQLLCHWSLPVGEGNTAGKEGGSKREDALRQMGLVKGLMGFLRMSKKDRIDDAEYRWVHSTDRTTLIWQPEPSFFIIAVLKTKFTSLTNTSTPKHKEMGEDLGQQNGCFSTAAINDYLKLDIRLAYERFRLLNGSLDSLLHENGPTGSRSRLGLFWADWARGYKMESRSFEDCLDAIPTRNDEIEKSEKFDDLQKLIGKDNSLILLSDHGIALSPASHPIPLIHLRPLLHYLQHCLSLSLPQSSPSISRRKPPPQPLHPRSRQSSGSGSGPAQSTAMESKLWPKSLAFDMWPRSASATTSTSKGGSSQARDQASSHVPPSPGANITASGLSSQHQRSVSADLPDRSSGSGSPSKWHVPGLGLGAVGGLFGIGVAGGSTRSRQTSQAGTVAVALESKGHERTKSEEGGNVPPPALKTSTPRVVVPPPLSDSAVETETSTKVELDMEGLSSALSDVHVAQSEQIASTRGDGAKVVAAEPKISSVWLEPFEVAQTLMYSIQSGKLVACLIDTDKEAESPDLTSEEISSAVKAVFGAAKDSRGDQFTPRQRPDPIWLTFSANNGEATRSNPSEAFDGNPDSGVFYWYQSLNKGSEGTTELVGRTVGNHWLAARLGEGRDSVYVSMSKPEGSMVDAAHELRRVSRIRDAREDEPGTELRPVAV